MDYLKRMNAALDYIESNLDGEIDYKIVANLACCSVFHFRRIFSFIADVPLSEYIRRRKMTLAALELKRSNVKIIDLAIKYGYESADSFSRAFQELHGIKPSLARNARVTLKAYPRITFHISIKGDVEMNYRIEKKEAFRIVGITQHYQGPKDDPSAVPTFWNELHTKGILKDIFGLWNGCAPKGVHGFIQILGEEKVDYTIACISDKEPLDGMSSNIIPESTWAIFEIEGSVSTAMEDAYKRIYSEWLPTSGYRIVEDMNIECFPHDDQDILNRQSPDYKFEIWIPVVKENDNIL